MKEIKRKAQKIVEVEKDQRYTELEQFISTLTVEEMFEIDEYIMEKKLLTFLRIVIYYFYRNIRVIPYVIKKNILGAIIFAIINLIYKLN